MHRGDSCACFVGIMVEACDTNDRIPDFFSSFAIESDDVRQIQMIELINGVKESPVFGHGFGSYISDYTRSGSIPFSYEIEYLSFCYQMGILGFVVFVGGVLLIYIKKNRKVCQKKHLGH